MNDAVRGGVVVGGAVVHVSGQPHGVPDPVLLEGAEHAGNFQLASQGGSAGGVTVGQALLVHGSVGNDDAQGGQVRGDHLPCRFGFADFLDQPVHLLLAQDVGGVGFLAVGVGGT